MNKEIRKIVFALIATSILTACQAGASSSEPLSVPEESSSAISSQSSAPSSQSSASSKGEASSNSQAGSKGSLIESSLEESSKEPVSSEVPISSESEIPSSEPSSLDSDPTTCDDHVLTTRIIRKATIVDKGIKRHQCEHCGGFYDEWYYDLDECAFNDTTYMYDGHERTLLIEGMIPYGVSVRYENNTLTEIGTKEAKAILYDEQNNVLATKTAKLSIVENVGLANVRVVTSTGEDPNYKEHDEYVTMTCTVDNCPEKQQLNAIPGGIRVRGNSTNQDEVTKRAWRLKFDKKNNMLGLNGGAKEKSWVLLADYFDQSLMRNATAFTLGNSFFNYSNNYCTDFKHVNFYMNGDYRGVYLLAEQQQAKASRININEADEDYEGTDVGYLVELDGLANKEDYYFSIGGSGSKGGGGGTKSSESESGGISVASKDYAVKTDVYGDEQLPFIKNYMTNVFTILRNAASGEKLQVLDENNELIDSPYDNAFDTVNAVLDLDSLFKTYVLQEYMKNYDVGWGSFYFYVDFSENSVHRRLTLGAPWDFDWSSGNPNTSSVYKATGNFCDSSSHTLYNPWLYLLSKTDFFQEYMPKYYSVFANSGMVERAMEYINYESDAFANEFDANYDRWGTLNGQKPSMYTRSDVVSKFKKHRDAADFLLNWMNDRKAYLDETWLKK